jgi:Flp pilus assembly protein TadB
LHTALLKLLLLNSHSSHTKTRCSQQHTHAAAQLQQQPLQNSNAFSPWPLYAACLHSREHFGNHSSRLHSHLRLLLLLLRLLLCLLLLLLLLLLLQRDDHQSPAAHLHQLQHDTTCSPI